MDDGAKKQAKCQGTDGQSSDSDHGQALTQEYDFFVTEEDDRKGKEAAGLSGRKRKKIRGAQNKSKTFFLSD